jgi:hypothetical protein
MSATILRRWGKLGGSALIGALVAALSMGLSRCDRVIDRARAETAVHKDVEGLLVWRDKHEDEKQRILTQINGDLGKLKEGQAWTVAVLYGLAAREGVPMPPLPSGLDIPPGPVSPGCGASPCVAAVTRFAEASP